MPPWWTYWNVTKGNINLQFLVIVLHFKESIKYPSQLCKDPLVLADPRKGPLAILSGYLPWPWEQEREGRGGEGERCNTQENGLVGENVKERGGFEVCRSHIFLWCMGCFLKPLINFLQGIPSPRTITIFSLWYIYFWVILHVCLYETGANIFVHVCNPQNSIVLEKLQTCMSLQFKMKAIRSLPLWHFCALYFTVVAKAML